MLGRGARMAARTVYDALDAATAPAAPARSAAERPQPTSSQPLAKAAEPARQRTRQAPAKPAVQQVLRSAARVHGSVQSARQGVFAPVKRASRAVSLEIAGSFYGLFALSFSVAAWRFRHGDDGGLQQRLWAYLALAVLFGYFSLSSFWRARRITQG